jgi:hypothetical protein
MAFFLVSSVTSCAMKYWSNLAFVDVPLCRSKGSRVPTELFVTRTRVVAMRLLPTRGVKAELMGCPLPRPRPMTGCIYCHATD